LSDFNEIQIFWTDFQKNAQMSNFIKIPPVGTAMYRVDRGTDEWTGMAKVNSRFSQF